MLRDFMILMVLALVLPNGFPAHASPHTGKRILWVESYHEGLDWTVGIARGVHAVLKNTSATLRVVHLDTKRNTSPEHAVHAGERAMAILREFKPDVVMASDDNAQRFFVVPYLKNSAIPVIFSAVNWDASEYGYPAPNVTGMIEVHLLSEAVGMLRKFARGDRIGCLAADSESERKNLHIYATRTPHAPLNVRLLKDFQEFAPSLDALQRESDMLILGGNGGIVGWDDTEAKNICTASTRIPTGSFDEYMSPFAIFTFSKNPEEFGQWMAATALRVLEGESPADIPMVENRQVRLIVNLKLAQRAGLVLPVSLLKTATIIGADEKTP